MGPTQEQLKRRRNFSWHGRLRRLLRYRLHIPLKRSRHSPQHTARGVMVGVVWAMTPIFGLQMAAVLLTWLAARSLFRWDFSLANGLAWTWVTNVFTLLPAFYVFYVTGQVMMGRFENLGGEATFDKLSRILHDPDRNGIDAVFDWVSVIASDWGLPLCIGWIPWAALSGWIAYRISLKFVIAYRERRARRMKAAVRT